MPAAARKISPDSYQDHHTTSARGAHASTRAGAAAKSTAPKSTPARTAPGRSTPSRTRWHETPSRGGAKGKSASARARREEESSDDWRGLVEHFGGEATARVEIEEAEVETRRIARRKARLKHRPFRMTLLASAMAGAPLALLACLLWMHSSALELSRQDKALQDKIEAARFELQSTRRDIASVNASPQVEHWARERGWRQATQQDFDDVSKVVTPTSSNSVSSEARGNDAP